MGFRPGCAGPGGRRAAMPQHALDEDCHDGSRRGWTEDQHHQPSIRDDSKDLVSEPYIEIGYPRSISILDNAPRPQ